MLNQQFDWVFFTSERIDIASSLKTSWWRRAMRAFTRGNERHAQWMRGLWIRRMLGALTFVYGRARLSKVTYPLQPVVSRLGKVKHPRRFIRWDFSVSLSESIYRTFSARRLSYLLAGLWEIITVHGDDYFDMRRSAQRREHTVEWLETPEEIAAQ